MSSKLTDSNLTIMGQNLKKFRLATGLSQEKLAIKAGVHRNYMGQLERGEENVSLLTLLKITKVLKIKIKELIGEL